MGRERTKQSTPDLFSTDTVRDASPPPSKPSAATTVADNSAQRHILPKNLRHAVKQLSDGELDELCEAAFDEAKRRGRLPRCIGTDSTPSSHRPSDLVTKRSLPIDKRRQGDTAEVPLTRGQLNAVRAAFKAGITPSRIARQFGISQANVRKALASDPSKA
jgi:predicted DNA-binding protein (UPF0251 family)